MHNITSIDRQEGKSQAWHGLTVLRPNLSLDNNWLRDWDVIPSSLYLDNGVQVPFRILMATDDETILIGYPYDPETYYPLTNAKFLDMVKEAVAGTDHEVISVGSVRNRGRTFVSFKMEKMGEYTSGGRKFEQYLNMGNGHDKSSVLWANTSNTATVCDNTFGFNLYQMELNVKSGKGFGVYQRHTANMEAKLPEISKLIDAAVGVQMQFANAFEALSGIKITKEEATKVYAGFVAAPDVEKLATRGKNIVKTMADLFESGKGNRGENLADLFSGATDYYTHEVAKTNPERRFFSSEFGTGAQRKREFWGIVNSGEKLEATAKRGSEVLN